MPRSSVTPTNLFPVASFEAVTVTPGSTAPVESVTVPVSTASCANAATGNTRIAAIRSTRPTKPEIMKSPSVSTVRHNPLTGHEHGCKTGAKGLEISALAGRKSRKTLPFALQSQNRFEVVPRVLVPGVQLHGSAQIVDRFVDGPSVSESCAEMPVGLRRIGLEA